MKQIVDTVTEINGTRPHVQWNPGARRVDIPRSVGDYSKARRELGWQPRVRFEDGVKKAIGWYRLQLKSGKA